MPTPKTVLITTAQMEISTVTRRACVTSGSEKVWMKADQPWANVRCTSVSKGQPTRKNTYAAATRRTAHLAGTDSSTTARHPSLNDVERHDDQQGDAEHDRGQRGSGRAVTALDEAEHPDRDRLGLER